MMLRTVFIFVVFSFVLCHKTNKSYKSYESYESYKFYKSYKSYKSSAPLWGD